MHTVGSLLALCWINGKPEKGGFYWALSRNSKFQEYQVNLIEIYDNLTINWGDGDFIYLKDYDCIAHIEIMKPNPPSIQYEKLVPGMI